MPCRHELSIYIKETKPLASLNIHKRWSFDHFDASVLPEVSEKEDETEEASEDSKDEIESQSSTDKSFNNDPENEEDENETDNEESEQVKFLFQYCLILD